MERLHQMLLEDEIMMCGAVLLLGILTGCVARFVRALMVRNTSQRD
jgi:hypothetical protein